MNVTRNLYLREIGKYSGPVINVPTTLECWGSFNRVSGDRWPSYTSNFCQVEGYTSILAVAFENGTIGIGDAERVSKELPNGFTERILTDYLVHQSAVFDVAWMAQSTYVISASGDETSVQMDLGTSDPRTIRVYKAHTSSVRRVDPHPFSLCEFATAGRDGMIVVWDTRCQRPSNVLKKCHPSKMYSEMISSVLDVKYVDPFHLISCGNADGVMKVWDLRKTHTVRQRAVPCHSVALKMNGRIFCNIIVQPGGRNIYTNNTNGHLLRYKMWSTEPAAAYIGKPISVCDRFCLSPDGEYIVAASGSNCASIWPTAINKSALVLPVVSLKTHDSDVTSISWSSQRDTLIVTASDDFSQRIWKTPTHPKAGDRPLGTAELEYAAFKPPQGFELDSILDHYPGLAPSSAQASRITYATQESEASLAIHDALNLHVTPSKDLRPMPVFDENVASSSKASTSRRALSPVKISGPGSRQPNTNTGARQLFIKERTATPGESHPTSFYLKDLPNAAIDVAPSTPSSVTGSVCGSANGSVKENVNWLVDMGRMNAARSADKGVGSANKSTGKKSATKYSSGKKRGKSPRTTNKLKGKSLLQYFPKRVKREECVNSDESD